MIPEALQPRALLVHDKALAQHLRGLIDKDSSIKNLTFINSCLLDQIHTEAIPSSFFHIWLFLACQYSSHFVPVALQDPLCGVRKAGIRVARQRLFRGPGWKAHGWDVLGGAKGIKNILDSLPLAEVQLLVKAISAHCVAFPKRQVVMECIEEFLVLVENADPWTTRSLLDNVSFLYAYCSVEKVTELLRAQTSISTAIFCHLGRFHTTLLRNIALGVTQMPPGVRQHVLRLCRSSLLHSEEVYVSIHSDEEQASLPSGLIFGMDMLRVMGEEPDLQNNHEIDSWIQSLFRLAIRKRLPFQPILDILNSGLTLCKSKGSSEWLQESLSMDVIKFWSIARFGGVGGSPHGLTGSLQRRQRSGFMASHTTGLEQCLIQQVLKIRNDVLAIHPRARSTRAVTKMLALVDVRGRLEFLQLLCLHSPLLNFDLMSWPPSEEERNLIPVWDYEILCILPPESSKLLFDRSLHIFDCEEFLPSSESGKKDSWAPEWEEQCLLWASWESLADRRNDDFPVTRKVIGEMKQKATRARDSAGRLKWAKSAIKIAVRAGSLDIFDDLVKWNKMFLRDPLVFPALMEQIIREGGRVISCRADLQVMKTASKLDFVDLVQKSHGILTNILETSLLLLREPWARKSVDKITRMVPTMFSTIFRHRVNGIQRYVHLNSATESDLFQIFIGPLISIFLDYEREGNTEGQTGVGWSGPVRLTEFLFCPDHPSPGELSFMDRLAKSRNELWEHQRAQTNPDVLGLGAGWPRGLPIQYLVRDESWVYHAMKRPNEAPYLSSRLNEVLFGSPDTIMTTVPKNIDSIDHFVDSLSFAINAVIAHGETADKTRYVLQIWKHYSLALQPHPLYRKLFQDWLSKHVRYKGMTEASDTIQPSLPVVKPRILGVPTGTEVIEWDPQVCDNDIAEVASRHDDGEATQAPCTILNCRMNGGMPSNTQSVTIVPQPVPKPGSLWSFDKRSPRAESFDASADVQDAIIFSALLFLDSYTKNSRILQTRFPDVEHPRYTPVYLADEFIARMTKEKPGPTLEEPLAALKKCAKRVPARVLRDIIWSFLDTLKENPKESMYSHLLFCTFDLIDTLLSTDKPQLAVDVVLRLWTDFAHDSSCHRKISLARIGRNLRPKQAAEMMQRLADYVCDALAAQQQQTASKLVIKVTTAKMLAQALEQADFLSESTRMQILQNMFSVSRHIDIRTEIAASILALVSVSDSAEPYKVFASIALSVAGPNERFMTTEDDWNILKREGGPLPPVATESDRPILELVVSTAATHIPKRFRPDYVQKVLLPLLQESSTQHTRWMDSMVAGLGLCLSDLSITESEIGPFSPNLVDKILWQWERYLPGTYLQGYHRGWSLSYLHHASFSRIAESMVKTKNSTLKDRNVQQHWNEFLKFQRTRPVLYLLNRLLVPTLQYPSEDLTVEMVLEDFKFRADAVAETPVRYSPVLDKYTVHPGYTLEILRNLRNSRAETLKCPAHRAKIYDLTTDLMMRIIATSERIRKEGWSTDLAAEYPVTLPTTFEYDSLMLPSPLYNPASSESNPVIDMFTSSIIALIHKYATDSVLPLKLDALQAVMREVLLEDKATCALRLGRVQGEQRDVEVCVRVKLAQMLLDSPRESSKMSERDIQQMLDEWKRSDIEIVRQIGWELE